VLILNPFQKMAGKKKGKGDKSKKAQKEVNKEATPWDDLGFDALNAVVDELNQDFKKAQDDRSKRQVELDNLQNLYNAAKEEIEKTDAQLFLKDNEIGLLEEEHRIEVRVYELKLKHLDYKHKNEIDEIEEDKKKAEQDEERNKLAQVKEIESREAKLRNELREKALYYSEEVNNIANEQKKEYDTIRAQIEQDLEKKKNAYEAKHHELEVELRNCFNKSVEDMEHQKKQHIDELNREHANSKEKMQDYYERLIKENKSQIRTISNEVLERRERVERLKAEIYTLKNENETLKIPLEEAQSEVKRLEGKLKHSEKNKISLSQTKSRLFVASEKLRAISVQHAELEQKYQTLVAERDYLRQKIEEHISHEATE